MKNLKKFAILNLGVILLAIGVYFFKIPNGFSNGGVTGIGTILAQITPITPGAWIWILNVTMLLVGFLFLGKKTGGKTVYCSMVYSGIIYVFEWICPLDAPLTNDTLLELVYAMLLTAIGSAIIFDCDGSSGGTDIAALILKKYTSINVGSALLFTDCLIAASSFLVFDVKTGLFSMLGLFAKAYIVDGIIESLNSCKYFVVITSKKDEVSSYIIKEMHHGATACEAIGEYTQEGKAMIHTVCRRMEAIKLRKQIKQIDPHAFIIITTSSEIIGRGFRGV